MKELIIPILSNLLWINIILAIAVIIMERRNPTTTWMWITILVLLPGFGFFIYLWLGRSFKKRKMFEDKFVKDRLQSHGLIGGKQILHRDMDKQQIFPFNEYADMIEMHFRNGDSVLTMDNEFFPIFDGEEFFDMLFKEIENAKSSIYIQTYIMRSDNMGKRLCDILKKKAREGLDVKLLIDGMGSRRLHSSDIKKMREAGVQVEIFFPFFLSFVSPRINYRNHRKIYILDGKIGYLGGFNVGDEYYDGGKKWESWRDSVIKIKGSAVYMLKYSFILDFNFASGSKHVKYGDEINEFRGKSACQIVTSGPDNEWPSIKDGFLKMISSAKDSIYIETPYFIPDDSVLESLRVAILSGVKVKLLLPFKGDHPFVFWASLSFAGKILEAGGEVYLYKKGFQHSKVMIMDNKMVSMGTANMDVRSFQLNFEANAFIYDEKIARQFSEKFIEDIRENSYCLTFEEYKKRSNWIRIKENVSRLGSPIL